MQASYIDLSMLIQSVLLIPLLLILVGLIGKEEAIFIHLS